MVELEKLSMRGIRCFSPRKTNNITFLSPLTLILGANGTGKTTIIECLKYISTGNLPPNSKNGAFIFDPKLINSLEIQGEIKLKFKNIKNKKIICSKLMQVTHKKSKVEQRTLENLLYLENEEGEKCSISGRCNEMDKEVALQMGVSTSILENVIFCHQEESTWILDEPRIVKKKMDDIFESTKYTKALENLKGQRKDLQLQSKLKTQELEFLFLQKQQKNKLDLKIKEIKIKIVEIEEQINFYVIESDKCNLINTELKNEIERLILLEKQNIELQIEYKNIIIFINGFKYEILNEENINLYKNINIEEDEELINNLETTIKKENKELEIKNKEKEEFLIKINLIDNLKKERKKIFLQIKSVNAERSALIDEFFKKMDLQEIILDSVKKLKRNNSNNNLYINNSIDNNYTIDNLGNSLLKIKEISVYSSMEMKSKLDKLREYKSLKFQELNEVKERINVYELEIKYLITAINNYTSDINISFINTGNFKSIDNTIIKNSNSIKELENEIYEIENELFNINNNIKEIENNISIKEKQLEEEYLNYENNLKNKLKEKRIKEIESILILLIDNLSNEGINSKNINNNSKNINNYSNEYLKIFLIEKYKLEKIIKEGKLRSKEKKNKKIIYQLEKQNKISSINLIKNVIRDKINEYKKYNSNEFNFELLDINITEPININRTVYEECTENISNRTINNKNRDVENDDMEECKSKIICGTNASKIYQKIKSIGIKLNECPICRKKFYNQERLSFVSQLDLLISKANSILESEILKIEKLKKNLEMERINSLKSNLIQEIQYELLKLKELINLNSLEDFLNDNEEFLDVLSSESDFYDLEERLLEINKNENLFVEWCMLKGIDLGVFNPEILLLEDNINNINDVAVLEDNNTLIEDNNNGTLMEEIKNLKNKLEKLKLKRNSLIDYLPSKNENLKKEKEIKLNLKNLKNKSKLFIDSNVLESEKVLISEINSLKQQISTLEIEYSKEWEYSYKLEKEIEHLNSKFTNLTTEYLITKEKLKTEIPDFNLELFNEFKSNLENKIKKLEFLKVQFEEKKNKKIIYNQNIKLIQMKSRIEEIKKSNILLEISKLNLIKEKKVKIGERLREIENNKSELKGELNQLIELEMNYFNELKNNYFEIEKKYKYINYELKIIEILIDDISNALVALDKSIVEFHNKKIEEVNYTLKQLWVNTYKGNDIEYCEIKAEVIEQKSYNYKLVMYKNNRPLEMRGRVSAGQKIICSILFRLALCDAFSNCNIITLDEPTTNLDESNVESLAETLKDIINKKGDNFQMVLITHDEVFLRSMKVAEVDGYYRIERDVDGSNVKYITY